MGKRLVIAEKPSVGRDIAAALGGFTDEDEFLESEDYVVTWALGHLLELAEPEDYDKAWRSWSIKLLPILPTDFQVKPKEGHKKRLDLIKRLGTRKDVSGVINACDAGREGELIFRRIVEHTGLDQKPTERLWLQSMTANAIREAFATLLPGKKMEKLGDAAWLRSVGDWLVGMNATRALTQRLKSKGETGSWSAGRVQTPTLALLVRRERDILAHIPRDYWEISATFRHPAADAEGQTWLGRYFDPDAKGKAAAGAEEDRDERPNRIFDRERVERLIAALGSADRKIVGSEKRRKSRQSPPLLFDLTSLQREANKRFTISAKRTLDAAQRLYEQHKLLTYPRTDAKYLPADYAETVGKILQSLATHAPATPGMGDLAAVAQGIVKAGPLNMEKLLDSSKISDHFAIVPTGNTPNGPLSGDDARVYELVVRQFLAAWMGPATFSQVDRVVEVRVDGEAEPARFRTAARTLEIPGYLEALGQEVPDTIPLPPLIAGQDEVAGIPVAMLAFEDEAKVTKHAPRFSEAQLLRMMETAGEQIEQEDLSDAMKGRGLGTPATRAETIEKLVATMYARRVEGKLTPTSKAMRLVDVLERADAGALTSPQLTGEWQHSLDLVESGERKRGDVQDALVNYTRSVVTSLVGFEHEQLYAKEPSIGTCPACGGKVVESAWGYRCEHNTGADSPCNFMIWKDRAGRFVDRYLATRLLTDRKVSGVEGFVDRAGRRFLSGTLRLEHDPEKGRWVLATDFSSGGPEGEEVRGDPLFPCPCATTEGHEGCMIVETSQRYVCSRVLDGIDRSGPMLPKLVCAREITLEEAVAFFSADAKTPLLENFTSKRNRPFKGFLVRKPTGKHGFEFPEREPRPGAEPGEAGEKRAGKPAGKGKKPSKPTKKAAKTAEPVTAEPPATQGKATKKAAAGPKKAAAGPKKAAAGPKKAAAAATEPAVAPKKASPAMKAAPAKKKAAPAKKKAAPAKKPATTKKGVIKDVAAE